MILALGGPVPRELDELAPDELARQVERLPPRSRGRRLPGLGVPPNEPVTLVVVGGGARAALALLESAADRAQVEAVLLVQPTAGRLDDLAPVQAWGQLAREACAPGGPLLALWCARHAPARSGQRGAYELAYEIDRAIAPVAVSTDTPLDAAALVAWPEGEILCSGRGGSWGHAPAVQVGGAGGVVLVVDTETRLAADELARLYGPGALVRGVLGPRWAAGQRRQLRPEPARWPEPPAAAPAAPELVQLARGAEALGVGLVRVARESGRVVQVGQGILGKLRKILG